MRRLRKTLIYIHTYLLTYLLTGIIIFYIKTHCSCGSPRLAILHFFLSSASWVPLAVYSRTSPLCRQTTFLLIYLSQGRSLQPFSASLSLQVVYLSCCRRRRLLSSLLKVGDHRTTHQFSPALPVCCCWRARRQSLASPVFYMVSWLPCMCSDNFSFLWDVFLAADCLSNAFSMFFWHYECTLGWQKLFLSLDQLLTETMTCYILVFLYRYFTVRNPASSPQTNSWGKCVYAV